MTQETLEVKEIVAGSPALFAHALQEAFDEGYRYEVMQSPAYMRGMVYITTVYKRSEAQKEEPKPQEEKATRGRKAKQQEEGAGE